MTKTEISIQTPDGKARGWVHRGDRVQGGVLMYPDAFGVRASIHEMADRLAGLGYAVLVPDVFYRTEYAPFDAKTVWTDPPERERLMKLIYSLTNDRVAMDGAAYLDALAAQPGVRAERLGTTGYCMGGRISFLNAALNPGKVRAAMGFHAGMLVADNEHSAHRLADRIQAAVYLGVADNDPSCTPEAQAALASALGAAHVSYTIELYVGKRHGFAVPDNHGAYDAEAAERHWRRMESFFGEHLA